MRENNFMSPRKNYPKNKRPHNEERDIATSNQSIEEHTDGSYVVRKMRGSKMMKKEDDIGTTHVGQNVEIGNHEPNVLEMRLATN
jgi:hypothetical protein